MNVIARIGTALSRILTRRLERNPSECSKIACLIVLGNYDFSITALATPVPSVVRGRFERYSYACEPVSSLVGIQYNKLYVFLSSLLMLVVIRGF